ncbi:MAG TPA: hypothetical protein VFP34_08450 [Microlunatus sp.]|nr:hypothetical protein [Microlunatus sp.]
MISISPSVRSAGALALAGLAFIAYPVLRGYGVETGLAGAALYARPEWLLAHVLGMVGFVLLAIGISAVDERAGRWATWGAFGVLPYYGAEAFGLHALGIQVQRTGHADMTAVADLFRYHPIALTVFALGWIAFGAVGVRLIRLARRRSGLERAGLLLVGIALLAYLPQFFLPAFGRIGHGVVLGCGLLLLGYVVQSGRRRPADVEQELVAASA